ncbi:hypothetical protein [Streptomyces sp. NPDC001978]|uniref:hypothetical protein n=1 Tax=Streptomyces sp. NPDC001978 TaxID=3364627 RepID=UPI0036A5B0CA
MGSLFEELEAREVAARVRVEELEAEVAELAGKLELARESLERLRIARETVAEVLAEMTPEKSAAAVDAGQPAAGERLASAYAGTERQVIGVLTVPNWQPGMGSRSCRGRIGTSWRWWQTRQGRPAPSRSCRGSACRPRPGRSRERGRS